MKITYLGQAGLLLETGDMRIMIDPYLSNHVETVYPQNRRRVPVDESFFCVRPDVLIFTHDHLDHYDPETAGRFLSLYSGITVLSPGSVWQKVRQHGGSHNYVLFNRHTTWREPGISLRAVKAEHSDPFAIGVILQAEGRNYYITGDTLYNEEIFSDIPSDIYALFLPVNGVGNNMNFTDAACFAARIRPQKTVPIHIGLFDTLSPESFFCENRVIAEIYKEVKL